MAKYQNKRAKTKALIIKNFLTLTRDKGLLNVKVSDIVKKSQINRKTFYRYFTNQPTLIKSIENHVLTNIKRAHARLYRYRKLDMIFSKSNPRRELIQFLDTFGKNRHIIMLLTGKHGDPMFSYQLRNLIQKMLMNAQSHFSIQLSRKGRQLFIHYFASGIYGLLQFWLHHFKEYSKSDIIHFLFEINQNFIKKFSR